MIGSTEYGEDFEAYIRDHVVAYLNVDVATKGSRFSMGGSPTLAHLLRQVALEIPHPTDANRTLWDARTDSGKLTGPGPNGATGPAPKLPEHKVEQETDRMNIRPLGSGSDYTVFLQRIGVSMGYVPVLEYPDSFGLGGKL